MSTRTLLALAGLALLAFVAIAVLWQQRGKPAPVAAAPTIPLPTNDKQLVVIGWTGDETRRVVADFARLYTEQLPANFDFEVASGGGVQRVSFPHDIAPWMLMYLVNYAQYPKAPATKGREIHIAGTATLSPDFQLPSQDLYGKKAVFYVPTGDTEYDNVYARIGEKAWKISFKGDHWEPVTDPRWPAVLAPFTGG